MSPAPGLKPHIYAARDVLTAGRKRLRQQHDDGSPGKQVCAALTDLFDAIVLDIFGQILSDLDEQAPEGLGAKVALAPHGGYGRCDVAPYSDVDLLLLHPRGLERRVERIAKRLVTDLGDCGLKLGLNVGTPRQICRDAVGEAKLFTSFVESRFLGGSVSLFTRFLSQLRSGSRRRRRAIIAAAEKARREERRQYGDTVYLLKPNLKKSPGGLRDMQFVRWVGFACHGESSLTNLRLAGALSRNDHVKLREAREFLLRLRNEMHFHAGKANDLLDRTEQARIAEKRGYPWTDALSPAQQFMREYFHHTSEIRYIASNFLGGAKAGGGAARVLKPLLSQQYEGDFLVGPRHIGVKRKSLTKVTGDLNQVLRLMDIANMRGKWIDQQAWDAIRAAMADRASFHLTGETRARFLSLLSQPQRLADLLRRLHELRVLEKIIPGMSHARGLSQNNDYHKYTVDEHCLKAVECVAGFWDDPDSLGRAYRKLKDKRLLHLALLVHDLGKGHEEDHSEVGRQLAQEAGERLALKPREIETLCFLVHKHLLMAHLAFRRDLNDESVAVQLAVEAGSPDVLQMLYLLTCADLAAVGPDVLTRWKLDLITRLYRDARERLAGEDPNVEQWRGQRQEELRAEAPDENREWWRRQIDALPASYLKKSSEFDVMEELSRLSGLSADDAMAWARPLPELGTVEYTVAAYEQIVPGIFHRLTGALSSKGHQILSAEIHSLADGLVLDRFHVQDLDFSGMPPIGRSDDVCHALKESLTRPSNEPPTFRTVWTPSAMASDAALIDVPARVRCDNDTSDQFTLIDVFARDRVGLLYAVTRALFELGLSVHVAKVGAYADQVVDAFYVTDERGGKVEDDTRLEEIRRRLLEAAARPEPVGAA